MDPIIKCTAVEVLNKKTQTTPTNCVGLLENNIIHIC